MIIRIGDTVRVLAPGKFQGQIVTVLNKKERKRDIDYQLDTKWDEKPYPGWFGHNEIEKIDERKEQLS